MISWLIVYCSQILTFGGLLLRPRLRAHLQLVTTEIKQASSLSQARLTVPVLFLLLRNSLIIVLLLLLLLLRLHALELPPYLPAAQLRQLSTLPTQATRASTAEK
jgi:hypothetical protein